MRGIGGLVGGLIIGFIISLMIWGGYSQGKKQGVEFSEVQFWVDLVVFCVCATILFLPR
jgi:ammonia channel protein AmtB